MLSARTRFASWNGTSSSSKARASALRLEPDRTILDTGLRKTAVSSRITGLVPGGMREWEQGRMSRLGDLTRVKYWPSNGRATPWRQSLADPLPAAHLLRPPLAPVATMHDQFLANACRLNSNSRPTPFLFHLLKRSRLPHSLSRTTLGRSMLTRGQV
jgi:hypothetical protein